LLVCRRLVRRGAGGDSGRAAGDREQRDLDHDGQRAAVRPAARMVGRWTG
jgi:hypothetical protein